MRRYLDEEITLSQLAQHYVGKIREMPALLRYWLQLASLLLLVGGAWLFCYVSLNVRGWMAEAWEAMQ